METTPTRIFKVIVLGDSSVGKTCLTYRFCTRDFLIQTESTIGVDFRERLLELVDKNDTAKTQKIKLQLWDTAGQERFRRSMVPHYYRNAHLVVQTEYVGFFQKKILNFFKLFAKQSYLSTMLLDQNHLRAWKTGSKSRITISVSQTLKIFLDVQQATRSIQVSSLSQEPLKNLSNKKISVSKLSSSDHYVSTELAQRFADIHNMPLFETSAKEHNQMDNVDSIFITLAHKLKDSKPFISRLTSNDSDVQLNSNDQTESACQC